MEGLNSEVANKMRSAVKAKLIEMGSGTAGYIDDELPDYVMIMVANKRSKEQMTNDLSLFLGKNTDVFVSWLHQVLEKLEEVTLPSTAVQQKKQRKPSESDKREKDKRAKITRKHSGKEKSPEPKRSTTPPIQAAPSSITDVFADHLIQKAKKVIEPPESVKKAERNGGSNDDNFDIPTISEMTSKPMTAVATVCRKEITELAELQKKIDQAKRQLRHMAEESEDEDFINLRTDRIDFDTDLSTNNTNNKPQPIGRATIADDGNDLLQPRHKITFRETSNQNQNQNENVDKKRSVHDRLGTKDKNEKEKEKERSEKSDKNENIISLSAHRRMEQAIYVPAHRRNSDQVIGSVAKKTERDRSPDRSSDRRPPIRESTRDSRLSSANRSRKPNEPMDLREKVRQRNRDNEHRATRSNRDISRDRPTNVPRDRSVGSGQPNRNEPPKPSLASRIGSRIIVAQTKIEEVNDSDEDQIEVPVNSVVKVQPRPAIPKSKQASKNLLLRAVAEAQKSIASAKPAANPIPFKATERNTKELYTKSFRNNLQKLKDNIVVEVATNQLIELDENVEYIVEEVEEEEEEEEEEYIPTSGSADEDALVYVPQAIHSDGLNENSKTRTQFVVTLDSLDFRAKKRAQPRPEDEKSQKRVRNEKKPSPKVVAKKSNESDSETELRKAVENSSNKSAASKRKRTPIRFDVDESKKVDSSEPPKKRRSGSNDRPSAEKISKSNRKSVEKDNANRGRDGRSHDREHDESSSKIRTLKPSTQNKYDNLPPLSSAITVTQNDNKPQLKKERCKFYPACTRGERCEYHHPMTPCKAFPNCKFGDVCLYIHPKCKFDLTCSRLNCNFTHTPITSAAPPLASHVVPVSNYKKIVATPLPTLCRFYPNCSNTLCEFYHPKPCKFGKGCTNKIECNFYHYDLPSGGGALAPTKNKMKWVASTN